MRQNTLRGYAKAKNMHLWADRKGGSKAAPDGFNRSHADTLACVIDEWIRSLEERHYSKCTIDSRRGALRVFLEWAEEHSLIHPEEMTKPILETYQRWLFHYRKADGRPLTVGSQRSRLAALQVFFAWLCRQNLLTANPAADLELPRKPLRSLPRALSREEICKLLSAPDIRDPLGLRDRTILETFYATGIRRMELAQLTIDDFDRSRGLLNVHGKGGKDRVVPIGDRACFWIVTYLEKTRPLLDMGAADRVLFLSAYGQRLNSDYIGGWVRRLLTQHGIMHYGSCHLFRHSCASHMLENGADIRYIQQLLGHARLDTTQIYTEVSIIQLREVHARTHPHGRLTPVPNSTPVPPQPKPDLSAQTFS